MKRSAALGLAVLIIVAVILTFMRRGDQVDGLDGRSEPRSGRGHSPELQGIEPGNPRPPAPLPPPAPIPGPDGPASGLASTKEIGEKLDKLYAAAPAGYRGARRWLAGALASAGLVASDAVRWYLDAVEPRDALLDFVELLVRTHFAQESESVDEQRLIGRTCMDRLARPSQLGSRQLIHAVRWGRPFLEAEAGKDHCTLIDALWAHAGRMRFHWLIPELSGLSGCQERGRAVIMEAIALELLQGHSHAEPPYWWQNVDVLRIIASAPAPWPDDARRGLAQSTDRQIVHLALVLELALATPDQEFVWSILERRPTLAGSLSDLAADGVSRALVRLGQKALPRVAEAIEIHALNAKSLERILDPVLQGTQGVELVAGIREGRISWSVEQGRLAPRP